MWAWKETNGATSSATLVSNVLLWGLAGKRMLGRVQPHAHLLQTGTLEKLLAPLCLFQPDIQSASLWPLRCFTVSVNVPLRLWHRLTWCHPQDDCFVVDHLDEDLSHLVFLALFPSLPLSLFPSLPLLVAAIHPSEPQLFNSSVLFSSILAVSLVQSIATRSLRMSDFFTILLAVCSCGF